MNIVYCLLVCVVLLCVNMGEGGRNVSTVLEPVFVPLATKQGSFSAIIHDGGTAIKVRDISFSGNTSVSGVREESTGSFDKLELGKLRVIELINPSFQSKRYSDQEFALVNVKTAQGVTVKDLLVPKNVIVCAIEQSSNISRAWWLRNIKKIEIVGELQFDAKDFSKKVFGKDLQAESQPQGKSATFSAEQVVEFEKGIKDTEKSSVIKSFIGIVDAFIGFIKVFFKKILQIIGF